MLTAPVRGSTPTLSARLSAVQPPTALCRVASSTPAGCPAPTALCRVASSTPAGCPAPTASAGSRRQLPFASPYHFRIRRDFRSKNPLSGFGPKQTKESSALAAYPHSATLSELFSVARRTLEAGIETRPILR